MLESKICKCFDKRAKNKLLQLKCIPRLPKSYAASMDSIRCRLKQSLKVCSQPNTVAVHALFLSERCYPSVCQPPTLPEACILPSLAQPRPPGSALHYGVCSLQSSVRCCGCSTNGIFYLNGLVGMIRE